MSVAMRRKVRKLFTTGQIAELLGISTKTIASYIDKGYLKGVELPGTSERRVPRQELRLFLVKWNHIWPLRELDAEEGVISPEAAGLNAAAEAGEDASRKAAPGNPKFWQAGGEPAPKDKPATPKKKKT